MNSLPNNLAAALAYAEKGFSVIPISQNKTSLIDWKEFQTRRASPEEIRKWFTDYPNSNVGVVTGQISGIVVVDVEAGGTVDGLPATVISKTGGGGWHYFYKYPGFHVDNKVRIRDKTDIRGDGGYVVMPPSQHKSGNCYEWSIGFEDADLDDLPEWAMGEKLKSAKPKIDWDTFVKEMNPEGTRNDRAAKLAGHILHDLSKDQADTYGWAYMKEWNESYNKPPLEEEELINVWESIRNREHGEIKVDTSQFKALSTDELLNILGLTIKHDQENKLVTFLCQLTAYTENAQFNISFNAPSSTGKSYIPLEVANLFPSEDVMKLGNCSPTAFFHEQGAYDKDNNTITVDLSRKVIIFLDQPHAALLERLRSLLSHDEPQMQSKITDKNQKGGNRTKTVIIKGFPSVIFCTAGLKIDEQEATRFLLLSPEVNQEKIRLGILESIKKEVDAEGYRDSLDENPERRLLKERIRAIKQAKISDIKISNPEKIIERFLGANKMLKPRHQRDIKRLTSLIKSFALLNLWWRNVNGTMVTANDADIDQAFKIWDAISLSQELNLPPYIHNLYQDVILKAFNDKNSNRNEAIAGATGLLGLSRQEVLKKHFEVYERMLPTDQLRQQILPMLEMAGLITQEADHSDKRKMLIYPTALFTTTPIQRNSEEGCGVTNTDLDILLG